MILEVGQLRPLPHGEVGELCIGGVHLARGYRNLPEQTAQKFITHPQFGRLYRTGDKCKIDIRTQRVHFLGRIDAQLKVRGHRVEAEAVEDILQTQFGEIEAAVLAYQNDSLVAFVAAPSVRDGTGSEVVPAPAPWAARVTDILSGQLPPPSVPTRIFLVENFVTNPISGKIDRKRLPDLSQLLRNATPRAEVAVGDARHQRGVRRESGPRLRGGAGDLQGGVRDPAGTGRRIRGVRRALDPHRASGTATPGCRMGGAAPGAPRRMQHGTQGRHPPAEVATHRGAPAGQVKSDADAAGRDEAAAEVLSVRYFTTLQVLFASVLYLPAFLAILGVADLVDVGTFGTARFSTF